MRLLRLVLVAGAAAALLAGCGEKNSSETNQRFQRSPETDERSQRASTYHALELTLDGEPGPETAGLLTASARGYLEDAGFGVTIYTPAEPARPVQYVAERTVDLAVSHEPQVVLSQEKGIPIVAIGSLVPEPTMAMIWLRESRIEDVADLKGKTVAIPGVPFQKTFLKAVLARAGLTLSDVRVKQVDYKLVPALLDKRADAIFGGSWNVEGRELEALGAEPVVTPVQDLGIPDYDELVVIARKGRVERNPELFRRFMTAVRRGTAAAIAHPEVVPAAIDLADENEFNRRLAKAGVRPTLPLLSEDGHVDPEQASALVDWMREQSMIQRELPASELIAGG